MSRRPAAPNPAALGPREHCPPPPPVPGRCDLAIVGGGASGLAAAIQAKRTAPQLRVILLERQPRVGKKLLATGNGRCNLTNLRAAEQGYHGGVSILPEAMRRYPPRAVIEFFQSLGVEPLCEGDKVYPLSEQAGAVLDALRLAADDLGVATLTDFEVRSITPCGEDGFTINGELHARRAILATGGPASPGLGGTDSGFSLLKSLGHRIIPALPALVQLKTPAESVRALSGIKCEGGIRILVDGQPARAERGEVLFTDYGLSGPPVLQLSRIASQALAKRKDVSVELSIFDQDPYERLVQRRKLLANRPLEHFLTGLLNKRLGQTLLKLSGCAPLSRLAGSLTDFELRALADLCACWPMPVLGTQGFANAQVSTGGADTSQFDPMTLESKLHPGLYVTGELMDVDGDCGGFNLQWAWASGLLAGTAAAGGQAR